MRCIVNAVNKMRLLLFLFMIVNISYKFITYECCLSDKIKLDKKKHNSEFITTATRKSLNPL